MNIFRIISLIFTLPMLVLLSCLRDEPLKTGYNGFGPTDDGDGWLLSTPSQEQMDSLQLDRVCKYIYKEDEYYLIRSLIIIRNGRIVAEVYPHDPEDRYRICNIKSATKSFTGLLAGIALQENILDSVNQPLSSIFPEYFVERPDLSTITLEHALTMRTGLSSDNKNDAYRFFMSGNSVDFALDAPFSYLPGTVFYYNDLNPQLVSYAIQRRYGNTLEAFAREKLFNPLGITEWYWEAGADGVSYGGTNLNLKPRDLARFGQMLLQNGRWQGQQVIDSTWLNRLISPYVDLGIWSYGYYFWINKADGIYWAAGHGGQLIMLAPAKNLLIVLTAWPYVKDSDPWKDNFEISLYKQVLNACH